MVKDILWKQPNENLSSYANIGQNKLKNKICKEGQKKGILQWQKGLIPEENIIYIYMHQTTKSQKYRKQKLDRILHSNPSQTQLEKEGNTSQLIL